MSRPNFKVPGLYLTHHTSLVCCGWFQEVVDEQLVAASGQGDPKLLELVMQSQRQVFHKIFQHQGYSLFIFYLCIYSFIQLIIHLFIYSFIHLFIYPFIHLSHFFFYKFNNLFIYSFIHLFIHSFINLSIYSFIHLFIYLFIYLLTHATTTV